MREELGQISQTGVKTITATTSTTPIHRFLQKGARLGSLASAPSSGGCHQALVHYPLGKCPHVLVSFFFLFCFVSSFCI